MVVFLLFWIASATAHRHLLSEQLILDEESGRTANAIRSYSHKLVRMKMDFDKLGTIEPKARAMYDGYCGSVSWINAAHDERSKREISLFASAAVVTASVIGSIAYPLGAGVAVGLSILNRLKISELEDEMSEMMEVMVLDRFQKDLDLLFYHEQVAGIFSAPINSLFLNATTMHNVMEVRARVRLVVRGCEGDNILTVAVYASNEDVIHGHIYRAGDIGSIDSSSGLYIYHEFNSELFLSEANDIVNVQQCMEKLGGVTFCQVSTTNNSDSCSALTFEEHCPRKVFDITKSWLVRKIGSVYLIASSESALMIRSANGRRRKLTLTRGGVTVLRLSTEESFEVDGRRYHGGAEQSITLNVKVNRLKIGLEKLESSLSSSILPSKLIAEAETLWYWISRGIMIGVLILLSLLALFLYLTRNYWRALHHLIMGVDGV